MMAIEQMVILKYNIPASAKMVLRLINSGLLHTQSDMDELEQLMQRYGRNQIWSCLIKLKKKRAQAA